jgi:hypothetical protein
MILTHFPGVVKYAPRPPGARPLDARPPGALPLDALPHTGHDRKAVHIDGLMRPMDLYHASELGS